MQSGLMNSTKLWHNLWLHAGEVCFKFIHIFTSDNLKHENLIESKLYFDDVLHSAAGNCNRIGVVRGSKLPMMVTVWKMLRVTVWTMRVRLVVWTMVIPSPSLAQLCLGSMKSAGFELQSVARSRDTQSDVTRTPTSPAPSPAPPPPSWPAPRPLSPLTSCWRIGTADKLVKEQGWRLQENRREVKFMLILIVFAEIESWHLFLKYSSLSFFSYSLILILMCVKHLLWK